MREKIPYSLAVALLVLSSGVAFAAPKKPVRSSADRSAYHARQLRSSSHRPVEILSRRLALGRRHTQWAQPTFDDSQWTTLDLTPQGDPFNVAMDEKNNVRRAGLRMAFRT